MTKRRPKVARGGTKIAQGSIRAAPRADDPDYIFLLDAIEIAGIKLYGDQWLSREMALNPPEPIPSIGSVIDLRVASRVAEILRGAQSSLVPEADHSKGGLAFDDEWAETPAAWAAAAETVENERERIAKATLSRDGIEVRLLSSFRSGQIRTFRGSSFAPLDLQDWHIEGWRNRFVAGAIQTAAGTTADFDHRSESRITVSRPDLEQAYPLATKRNPLPDIWDHLSPHMQIAIVAAGEIRAAGHKPQAKILGNRLIKLAKQEGIELGPSLAPHMATIILGTSFKR